MSFQLTVYDNGDHTCLVWLPTDLKPLTDCRGFTIRRLRAGKEDFLHGAVGFSDADTFDPKNPWKFPVQRFMWWDYGVVLGDTVQYSVVPVVGSSPQGRLALDRANASPLTPAMTITGQSTPHISSYFNKGIVASQWISRAINAQPKKSSIKQLVAETGNTLRDGLSGLLRPQILSFLEDARKNHCKIFAALYELNDPELIPALTAFGQDCNLILANGAFKSNTAPGNDENSAVRAQLRSKVHVIDRIVSLGHFAHNKFVVVCDSTGKNALRVLTGSTNWTSSGLCTQANNALIVDDHNVADAFLQAWHRLEAARNDYTTDLVTGNSTTRTFQVDGCRITPWFVKTSAQQDLEYARKLINAAKDGILFLFFNPGTFQDDPMRWTLLQNILERHHQQNKVTYDPDLYFCGVVNQDIPSLTTPGPPEKGSPPGKGRKQPDAVLDPTNQGSPVTLFKNASDPPQHLGHDVLVPHNIKDNFHAWLKELLGASMVNIHSKVIVLDPFGANPVVMTGSHNLGFKASNANDDNLVIIEGNAPLAAAYAINIIAIFQTYRWNSYVEAHRNDPKVWHGPVDNDQWQQTYLTGAHLAEYRFWLGRTSTSTPAPSPLQAVATATGRAAAPKPNRKPNAHVPVKKQKPRKGATK